MAVVVLLAVIVLGAIYLYRHPVGGTVAPASPAANINVTVPTPSSGGSSSGSSGTSQ